MIDIHCHLLPGIDDGSPDMETSLAMCRAAAAEGVTHIVGTPHCSGEYEYDPEVNARLREQVQKACGPKPVVLTGCDFHLDDINLDLLNLGPERFTIAQKNHLLVENSNFSLPPNLEQLFFDLRCKGIIPVLTHPERNPIWQRKPDLLRRVVRQDCVIQVTAGAITGRFGKVPQKLAMEWLGEGLVHVVASDAHNMSGRPLKLREAFDRVSKETSPEVAELLFVSNPRSIIEGGAIQHPPPPKKRRWGFF